MGNKDNIGESKMESALTRRSLLQILAATAATSAIPLKALAVQEATQSSKGPASNDQIIARMCSYMANAGTRELPEDVIEKTKHHILDTIAAMISGVDLPPGKIAMKFARAHSGEKVATVVGSKLLCGSIEAALANGMMAHSDETDDSHAPSHSHPGCSIVPATLAAGEQFGISGSRFIRAVALGYDIGTRVMMTLGGLPFQIETHHSSHNIAANFGAGAAAACAANLDVRQMRFALDYASQQASGIAAWQRDTEHIEKSLVFGGTPARNAVTSAILIQLGATGVEDVFSGPDNFIRAFAPKADPATLLDKLGERYEVTRTNIKKWTVGSPIQAPLDALQALMKRYKFRSDQVQSVIVRVATSEAKTVNNRDMPNISLQHMLAVMLVDSTVSFQAAHDKPRMKDAAVLREKAKIRLTPDEELEKLYPKRVTIVEVNLTDGKHLEERVEAVKGTAENPMTREEVVSKATDLIEPFFGASATKLLTESIINLEKLGDIRAMRPLLQRG
ncbi:MAG: MmgE/PrpD family protein [Acidobacteriales bacterium]|nr:MmgE/PrpD family protein [Terriglobales bacterium]